MPVSGSTTTASWAKRPRPSSGVGFSLLATFTGSTSNTNPWSLVSPPSPVTVLGLLARQPRTPRGDAAGAVDRRAGQADVLGDDVVVGVELGRRRPAERGRVVGELGSRQRRELDRLVLLGVALLAVADEEAPAVDLEQGGAVEGVGQHAVGAGERLAGLGDDLVGEPLGQVEERRRGRGRAGRSRSPTSDRSPAGGGEQAADRRAPAVDADAGNQDARLPTTTRPAPAAPRWMSCLLLRAMRRPSQPDVSGR